MANPPKPPLSIVLPLATTTAPPPANLGEAGCNLWRSVLAQFDISDAGGLLLLEQAAFAADRVERLRAEIDKDGEILVVRGVRREHPGLKAELGGRAFICRTLQRLGINLEPLRSGPGRPPGLEPTRRKTFTRHSASLLA